MLMRKSHKPAARPLIHALPWHDARHRTTLSRPSGPCRHDLRFPLPPRRAGPGAPLPCCLPPCPRPRRPTRRCSTPPMTWAASCFPRSTRCSWPNGRRSTAASSRSTSPMAARRARRRTSSRQEGRHRHLQPGARHRDPGQAPAGGQGLGLAVPEQQLALLQHHRLHGAQGQPQEHPQLGRPGAAGREAGLPEPQDVGQRPLFVPGRLESRTGAVPE